MLLSWYDKKLVAALEGGQARWRFRTVMPEAVFDRMQVKLREDTRARQILSEFDIDGGRRVIWRLPASVWSFNQWDPNHPPVLTVIARSENELATIIRRIGLLLAKVKV